MLSSVFLCYLYGLGSELMNCELCFLHIFSSSRKSLVFTSQYLLMCFRNDCDDQQTSAVRKKSYFQLAGFERKVFLSKHEKDVIFYKWSLGRVFCCQHWPTKYSTRKQLLTLLLFRFVRFLAHSVCFHKKVKSLMSRVFLPDGSMESNRRLFQ